MSTPLQSSISKIRREITDHLDALENLATSKAKALETAEQSYLELERERDGLNRDQTQLADRVDDLKAELANRTTAPRVITSDELKSWQWIAAEHNGHWRIIETGDHVEDLDRAETLDYFFIYPGDTIVLLEDTPAEEPEPVSAEDIRESGPGSTFEADLGEVWEWDGSRLHIHLRSNDSMHASLCDPEDLEAYAVVRSTAPSRGDYSGKAPKVGDTVRTVAELDGLAYGSVVLDYFDGAHQKADGVWCEVGRLEERDAAGMLTYGPVTVLYLPEEDA